MYDRALTNTVDSNSPVVRPIVQRGLINLEFNSVKNILQFYFNLDRLRSISISDLLSYLTSGRNLSNPNPNPNLLGDLHGVSWGSELVHYGPSSWPPFREGPLS